MAAASHMEHRLVPYPQRETNKLLAAIKDAKNKAGGPKVELSADDDLLELDEQVSAAEAALADGH